MYLQTETSKRQTNFKSYITVCGFVFISFKIQCQFFSIFLLKYAIYIAGYQQVSNSRIVQRRPTD